MCITLHNSTFSHELYTIVSEQLYPKVHDMTLSKFYSWSGTACVGTKHSIIPDMTKLNGCRRAGTTVSERNESDGTLRGSSEELHME